MLASKKVNTVIYFMLASKKVKVLLIMDFNYDANINIMPT